MDSGGQGPDIYSALVAAGIGIAGSVGQALMRPSLTWRYLAGSALVGAPLGMSAHAITLLIPSAPPLAIWGLAGALIIVGKDVVVEIARKRFGGGKKAK